MPTPQKQSASVEPLSGSASAVQDDQQQQQSFHHPYAPPPDPRLRSTPERLTMIRAKVPTLDFTKLRGGHRKPAAPVALAALKALPTKAPPPPTLPASFAMPQPKEWPTSEGMASSAVQGKNSTATSALQSDEAPGITPPPPPSTLPIITTPAAGMAAAEAPHRCTGGMGPGLFG